MAEWRIEMKRFENKWGKNHKSVFVTGQWRSVERLDFSLHCLRRFSVLFVLCICVCVNVYFFPFLHEKEGSSCFDLALP